VIKLNVNHDAVSALLAFLTGTPEQIEFLRGVVQSHGANPADFYVNNPAPNLSFDELKATPYFQQQDWQRLAHPHVMAQLLVDLCEKASAPLPPSLFVAIGTVWEPLEQVEPTYRAAAPAPAPAPDPYPQPVPVASTPPAPATLQLQPDPEVLEGELLGTTEPALVTRPMPSGATVTMTAEAAQQIDAARDTPRQPLNPAQTLVHDIAQEVAMPVQPQPSPSPVPALAGAGQFGLPQPFMTASKGTSVFDKDPEGSPPTSPSPRQIRDLMALMPHLFAAPASDVVGKGKGSVQRHRLYTAALLMLHTALSSVPDKNCSVGYLLWHIEHLRYNASQTPGGQTMMAFEKWLYADGGEN
jgi:hypothetical protein